MWETWVWSLGWEDPLEKEMATHSSILAWKISWTLEPGRLQPTGSQRVGDDWATNTCLLTYFGKVWGKFLRCLRWFLGRRWSQLVNTKNMWGRCWLFESLFTSFASAESRILPVVERSPPPCGCTPQGNAIFLNSPALGPSRLAQVENDIRWANHNLSSWFSQLEGKECRVFSSLMVKQEKCQATSFGQPHSRSHGRSEVAEERTQPTSRQKQISLAAGESPRSIWGWVTLAFLPFSALLDLCERMTPPFLSLGFLWETSVMILETEGAILTKARSSGITAKKSNLGPQSLTLCKRLGIYAIL